MADQYAKDGSSKDQGVSPSLNPSSPDLASMFQDPHWNESNALRWADILSEEPPHSSHDCNVQSSSSLIPDPTLGVLEDDWFNMYSVEDDLSLVDQGLILESSSVSPNQHQAPTRIGSEGQTGSALSMETISPFFTMPLVQAAEKLGVSATTLKLRCRELGISSWPHRKLRSIQSTISRIQNFGRVSGGETEERTLQIVKSLEDEMDRMKKFPDLEIEPRTLKLRQMCYKDVHTKKKALEEAASSLLALEPKHESSPPGCSTTIIKSLDHKTTDDEEEPRSKRTKLVTELYTNQA